MGYISKIDTKFITFINRKYNKSFNYFDDYIIWLYRMKRNNQSDYYAQLEEDLWQYSDFQTGTPRSKERRKNKGGHDEKIQR